MPAKSAPKKLTIGALGLVDLFDGLAAGADSKAPPSEFRIFKKGVNSSVKGDFLFDDQAAADVMGAYAEHGVELTIDYDHHTLLTGSGVQAISAGWFGLEVRDGELWACNVRWTPKATDHLEAGEYRYFSPLFNSDASTGRIEKVLDLALTNTPALFDIDALVAASAHTNTEGGDQMDPKLKEALDRIAALEAQAAAKDAQIRSLEGQSATVALSATVGLGASATPDEVRTRVVALTAFRKDVLGLVGKDTDAAALGALTGMKEKADAEPGLREKLDKAEATALSASWGAHLDGLSTKGEDGKFLPPAKRKKAEEMALDLGGGKLTALGIEKAKGYAAEMLVVADGSSDGDKQRKTNVALSAMELEIAQRSGSSVEVLTKYKEKKLAAGA
jgi:phage I-like protein